MSDRTGPAAQSRAARPEDEVGKLFVTWGPVALVSAAIFLLSSRPAFGAPNVLLTAFTSLFSDYAWFARYEAGLAAIDAASSWIAHFVEFAVLALAALWAVHHQWPAFKRPYAAAFAFAALFALSDEFHQYFVPGRHADWRDVATDMLGAALALGLVWAIRRSRPGLKAGTRRD